MYTLLGCTNKFAPGNLRVLLKLFDRIILPICICNSELREITFSTKGLYLVIFQVKDNLKTHLISFIAYLLSKLWISIQRYQTGQY